jgi:predicted RNA-binding protein with PUA-like domain
LARLAGKKESAPMTTWIFQANPKRWDIDRGLRPDTDTTWNVNQAHFEREMRVGDDVFIWRSDGGSPGTGGIVGRARVIGRPRVMQEDSPSTLWRDPSIGWSHLRVPIHVTEVRLNRQAGMLMRIDLLNTPQLADLLILRMANMTNYRVEPRHADLIRRLWDAARRPG